MPKCKDPTCANLVSSGYCPSCEERHGRRNDLPVTECAEPGCGNLTQGGTHCVQCEDQRKRGTER
jgi:hypothetical protein